MALPPVFPLAYCPPISWFALVCREEKICLELAQPYQKQQYTNRMFIRVSNQVMPLSIPVERRSRHAPIREKRIAYQQDWQRHHWRSIRFAYQNSPFFAFYEDFFHPFYKQPYEYLAPFHLDWLKLWFELLGKKIQWEVTQAFRPAEAYARDYREAFDPVRKSLPIGVQNLPYPQVFEGFEPDLSILDLLCNLGPESLGFLQKMGEEEAKS
jgi:hypothetical protein